MLAAMAATLPAQGDDGVATLVEELKTDPLFEDDKTVAGFIWTMQQMAQFLADAKGTEVFERAARALDVNVDLATATERLGEQKRGPKSSKGRARIAKAQHERWRTYQENKKASNITPPKGYGQND